ncbi:hypothetical protein FE810_13565 [Thalassotalea litorea]|uniref:Uncharacterized protein n=1 Tax=Thalassotalea litorea TaxID=2020715 RepID=A0A5R9IE06_9GAMM|nr:hypothetical protein [Thalassotalea litorea]TLU61841.1 hypothetical protein FE810_13565 [Thalassotalea litorea]
MSIEYEKVKRDKHMFQLPPLPLLTIYDDNLFVRNDYDILSSGQRQYLIQFFKKLGFQQTSGRLLTKDDVRLHFPKPQHILAQSAFDPQYLTFAKRDYYFVTPTTFAETIFQQGLNGLNENFLSDIHALIDTCPFNLELLRDININNALGPFINRHYTELEQYQRQVIVEKFKNKKAL